MLVFSLDVVVMSFFSGLVMHNFTYIGCYSPDSLFFVAHDTRIEEFFFVQPAAFGEFGGCCRPRAPKPVLYWDGLLLTAAVTLRPVGELGRPCSGTLDMLSCLEILPAMQGIFFLILTASQSSIGGTLRN